MKKITALILILVLCAALAACGQTNTINIDPAASPNTITNLVPDPEQLPAEEAPLTGEWYAQQYGLIICLSLDAESKYTMTMPSVEQKSAEGTWSVSDELIYLDGSDLADLSVQKDGLYWIDAGILFTREMPQVYAPGKAVSAQSGDLDGYWKVAYVRVGEAYVSAELLDDNTDIYIEGNNVALGGAVLGDDLAKFELEGGSLVLKAPDGAADGKDAQDAGAVIMIELLDDGMMRLTLNTDGQSVLILEKMS